MIKAITVLNALKLSGVNSVYIKAIQNADDTNLWAQWDISTDLRMAMYLSQILTESGGLRSIRENMSYSASQISKVFGVNKHSAAVTTTEAAKLAHNPQALAERVYGLGNPRKARELGNTRPGDGYKMRGGGPLQTTGGNSYKHAGELIGIDLYGNPDLIADPRYILQPSLIFWRERGCNVPADANDIASLTRKINGGMNGYADRVAWFNRIWKIIQASPTTSTEESPISVGTGDPEIRALQYALNTLGANPRLKEDGIMGKATETAVRAFQRANKLHVDGIVGPVTQAAIDARMSPGKVAPLLSTTQEPIVEHATARNLGASLTAVSVVAEQGLSKVQQVKEMLGDNIYLQVGLGVVLLAGLGFILYAYISKYMRENTTILLGKED